MVAVGDGGTTDDDGSGGTLREGSALGSSLGVTVGSGSDGEALGAGSEGDVLGLVLGVVLGVLLGVGLPESLGWPDGVVPAGAFDGLADCVPDEEDEPPVALGVPPATGDSVGAEGLCGDATSCDRQGMAMTSQARGDVGDGATVIGAGVSACAACWRPGCAVWLCDEVGANRSRSGMETDGSRSAECSITPVAITARAPMEASAAMWLSRGEITRPPKHAR